MSAKASRHSSSAAMIAFTMFTSLHYLRSRIRLVDYTTSSY